MNAYHLNTTINQVFVTCGYFTHQSSLHRDWDRAALQYIFFSELAKHGKILNVLIFFHFGNKSKAIVNRIILNFK